jgi:NAD(P)-dependent dehydrogenase (short-subunit alcohol dehydrogenase family)
MANTMGVIANIRAASKVLPDGGRIIFVGTGLGSRVLFPGTTDYAATKAAIVGYTRGPPAISAVAISPSTLFRRALWILT